MAETKANTNYTTQFKLLAEEIKKQGYKNICFWLPADNVGGGTYIFCKIAEYLSKNTNFNLFYMDYKGGYPSKLLANNPDIKILTFDDNTSAFPLKEKCIIVTNSTRVIQIKNMNPENKILFWHYETILCAWHLLFLDNETKRIIVNHNYNIGPVLYNKRTNQSLETDIAQEKRYKWTGKIGLMNVSDFVKASNNPNCKSVMDHNDATYNCPNDIDYN